MTAKIHLIHVLAPEITPETMAGYWRMDLEVSPPVLTEAMQEQLTKQSKEEEEAGKTLLRKSKQSLENLKYPINTALRRGDAATEIIDYAEQNKIDLIISGSRGLSEFKGWLLGSVSRKLVHYAGCSTLIVKMSPTD
jgi:nucleotide-binding universal stress UspA family protein